MLVRETKLLNGSKEQYQALDQAIRTAQFIRNKCVRYWIDNQGTGKADLYSLCKELTKEFPFARKLNSAARQASAERAWASISNFYRRCKAGEDKKGYPKFQKHCRSVEYKVSGWKLSADGMQSKTHLKVQRQRKNWAIKQARCVIHTNDVIVYEDLKVRNMVKNHHLAKSISDASWYQFTQWLDYYGKIWDKAVVAVSPNYTSQDCSSCGHRVKKTLSTRTHQCPNCGMEMCRDTNAALNILKKGMAILGMDWQNSTFGQKGTALPEGTTGEMIASAMDGQPEMVSNVAEPVTRILAL